MVKIRNFKLRSFELSGFAIVASTMAVGAVTPAMALVGSGKNPYAICAVSLDKSAIKKEVAAMACAEALHPDDMSACVEQVSAKKVNAMVALSACRSVRRPLELATCLSDIHTQDDKVVLTEVLDFCRRSLLPQRYGQCVVGLKDKPLAQTTAEALPTCIDASDRPTDIELLRTFEPIDKVPSIRNPMGSPIVPPTFVPGPFALPSASPSPSTPSNPVPNPSAPSPSTTPQLF